MACIVPYNNITPAIATDAFIAPTAAIIGDVKIYTQASIWFGCTLRGDVNNIIIGARSNIQDGTIIHVATKGQGTYVGEDVTVGHGAILHACTVGDLAFIGMQACIMDDVTVKPQAMVAAGALVTPGKTIPSGELWGGRPARKMRDLTGEERAFLKHSADRYVMLSRNYLE